MDPIKLLLGSLIFVLFVDTCLYAQESSAKGLEPSLKRAEVPSLQGLQKHSQAETFTTDRPLASVPNDILTGDPNKQLSNEDGKTKPHQLKETEESDNTQPSMPAKDNTPTIWGHNEHSGVQKPPETPKLMSKQSPQIKLKPRSSKATRDLHIQQMKLQAHQQLRSQTKRHRPTDPSQSYYTAKTSNIKQVGQQHQKLPTTQKMHTKGIFRAEQIKLMKQKYQRTLSTKQQHTTHVHDAKQQNAESPSQNPPTDKDKSYLDGDTENTNDDTKLIIPTNTENTTGGNFTDGTALKANTDLSNAQQQSNTVSADKPAPITQPHPDNTVRSKPQTRHQAQTDEMVKYSRPPKIPIPRTDTNRKPYLSEPLRTHLAATKEQRSKQTNRAEQHTTQESQQSPPGTKEHVTMRKPSKKQSIPKKIIPNKPIQTSTDTSKRTNTKHVIKPIQKPHLQQVTSNRFSMSADGSNISDDSTSDNLKAPPIEPSVTTGKSIKSEGNRLPFGLHTLPAGRITPHEHYTDEEPAKDDIKGTGFTVPRHGYRSVRRLEELKPRARMVQDDLDDILLRAKRSRWVDVSKFWINVRDMVSYSKQVSVLCIKALYNGGKPDLENCREKIGMNFQMSIIVSATAAAMVILSTTAVWMVLSRLQMYYGKVDNVGTRENKDEDSPDAIEKASEILTAGYVGGDEVIPAFVDARINTDLCVLTVSLRTRIKSEKLFKYLTSVDYRIRESLSSTVFTLDNREDFQELPAARMYMVVLQYSNNHMVLENNEGRHGLKFFVVNSLVNRGADVLVLYVGDTDSHLLPLGTLYNKKAAEGINVNFLVRALCRRERFLTINKFFTITQELHMLDWMRQGLNVERFKP